MSLQLRTLARLAMACIAIAGRALGAQVPTTLREFRVDAGHSMAAFAIPFLGHPVRGRFDDVRGTIVYAPGPNGAPGASAVTIAIRAASINTGSTHRDEHLRSADFFDADRFPTIVFQSRSVTRRGNGYVLSGPLTMHGVTRDVAIPFTATWPTPYEDPHGSTLVVFSGALRLARKDFGILGGSAHNDWFDAARSAAMGDSVDVTIELEGWRTDFARTHTYDASLDRVAKLGIDSVLAGLRARQAADPKALAGAEWDLSQITAAMLDRRQSADALAVAHFATELFPQSADAKAALARAYEVAGLRDSAVSATRAALSLDASHPRALELKRRLER